jgi:hypothetical protein
MEVAYSTLLERPTVLKTTEMSGKWNSAKDGKKHPRLVR